MTWLCQDTILEEDEEVEEEEDDDEPSHQAPKRMEKLSKIDQIQKAPKTLQEKPTSLEDVKKKNAMLDFYTRCAREFIYPYNIHEFTEAATRIKKDSSFLSSMPESSPQIDIAQKQLQESLEA